MQPQPSRASAGMSNVSTASGANASRRASSVSLAIIVAHGRVKTCCRRESRRKTPAAPRARDMPEAASRSAGDDAVSGCSYGIHSMASAPPLALPLPLWWRAAARRLNSVSASGWTTATVWPRAASAAATASVSIEGLWPPSARTTFWLFLRCRRGAGIGLL